LNDDLGKLRQRQPNHSRRVWSQTLVVCEE
jgi:hypothetical protein